jgi:hypothetical protein
MNTLQPDSTNNLQVLQDTIARQREEVVGHSVYGQMGDLHALRVFMEHHVYAVWDFMSLLKYLQNACTCVSFPWILKGTGTARRLVNDIVMGEESDEAIGGGFKSHLEMYLEAMKQAGADTSHFELFLQQLTNGAELDSALEDADVPPGAAEFVRSTFRVIAIDQPHAIAAAFTFGREDLIPDMFRKLVKDLAKESPNRLELFNYYLERHIHLDDEEHGPMALQLVKELCGSDNEAWHLAIETAKDSLAARHRLWESVKGLIISNRLVLAPVIEN